MLLKSEGGLYLFISGASTSLKGEGGLYLFISGASASLKGAEGLSHLHWMSTLEEKPTLGVLSMFKHLGQKSGFGAHAHEEAYIIAPYHPWGV